MKCDGEEVTEWTEKLQPAVIEANTQTKKSTSFTPFYIKKIKKFKRKLMTAKLTAIGR